MLRHRIARRLEQGSPRSLALRSLAAFWELVSDPVRPVPLPAGAHVIGVGGATLGGAGKTPTVAALARALPGTVAVVASAYAAAATRAQVIRPDDAVSRTGDEPMWLACALRDMGVPTVLGTRRVEAMKLASSLADTVIVDGLLQTRPKRLGCSLLVLDAVHPWGANHCPPAGDLRARPDRLLAASDAVLLCEDPALPKTAWQAGRTYGGPVFTAESELMGATAPDGSRVSLSELAGLTVGLVLAIARPDRVERALRARGIVPTTVKFFLDHSVPAARSRHWEGRARAVSAGVDAWLTTSKCATKLGDRYDGAPVWVLDHRVSLPPDLIDLCATN